MHTSFSLADFYRIPSLHGGNEDDDGFCSCVVLTLSNPDSLCNAAMSFFSLVVFRNVLLQGARDESRWNSEVHDRVTKAACMVLIDSSCLPPYII